METKPNLINGLTWAEGMQLGFDHLAQHDITEEIIRFRGINVDKLDSFEAQIKSYRAEESLQAQRQAAYDKLHTWTRETADGPYRKPNEIVEAGLRTAGVMAMNKRNNLRAEHYKVLEEGTSLSITAVDYFRDRCPDTEEIVIAGKPYELKYDVITRNLGKSVLVFASGEHHKVIARQVYGYKGDAIGKIADIKDWEVFLAGLKLVTKL